MSCYVATSVDAMQRVVQHDSQTSCGAGANLMRSASLRDGVLRKCESSNCDRLRDGVLSFRVAGTKLMRVRWTTLFVATSVDATQS